MKGREYWTDFALGLATVQKHGPVLQKNVPEIERNNVFINISILKCPRVHQACLLNVLTLDCLLVSMSSL